MKKAQLGLLITSFAIMGGCAKLDAQVNAGGTLNSKGGAGKAVFTAHAARCDGEVFLANYKDNVLDWQQSGGASWMSCLW